MTTRQEKSVLFVCSANQCRSPMAEALFIKYLNDNGYDNSEWVVSSAGCWARIDIPATRNANAAMEEIGTNLHMHKSQPVSEKLLDNFTLILCMENDHKSFISRNFPDASDRVFLMSEMISKNFDVDDPVGGSLELYLNTVDLLTDIIKNGFIKIKDLIDN